MGFDAYAYWALDGGSPYAQPNGQLGAFLYPPPLVRLFDPVGVLPWPAFWLIWTALSLGTAIWLGGRRALLVLAFPPVALELYHGNVNLLVAAAVALGFRHPWTWALVLLTKVSPGIGLLWFAVRREWRQLGIALAATGAIVAVSLIVDLPLWAEWIAAMTRDAGADLGGPLASPLWLRLPIAFLVVVWGARTNRPWTVPLAATLAMPVLWLATLSVLAATVAIQRDELRADGSGRRATAEA